MTIHEFGKENAENILLIHPSVVRWDYFKHVIPLLEKKYHLLIPALPGYDLEDESDFTSVEQIADELNAWLQKHGYRRLYAVYGCSMGGSIALMVALGNTVRIDHCIMDGGITPYQIPWIVTRLIAVRDFVMVMFGKWGGVKLLEKVFSPDDYSKEEIQYVADILKQSSKRTLWRTFDSCNNYKVPDPPPKISARIHYWYADGEEKERAWDIKYMKDKFLDTEFKVLPKLGHAGLVLLKPELFADMIEALRKVE
ncbi:MAG: alpha/beta hydrolase [Blautia sp.]|nr:alpha/beta hydrolase [Lachnoclostridium sp.]MCM1212408.1 alpha/beta hydrolase [Blautia sp.]